MAIIAGSPFSDNNTTNGDGFFHSQLNGTANSDTIYGYAGNDILDGKEGADVLIGGTGDDQYYVDNANDKVIENLNEGVDGVRSIVSYALGNHVETLLLLDTALNKDIDGTGNDLDNNLIGNSGRNYLRGNGGRDVLNGGAGDDTLEGGVGDDYYVVDSLGDKIVDSSGTGIETVLASLSWDLRVSYQPGNPGARNEPGVEMLDHLTLLGGNAINGTGNKLSNTIKGNNSRNELYGLGGSDQLTGLGGDDILSGGGTTQNEKDVLTGNSGADTFILATSRSNFYVGDGTNGYALLTDFNSTENDKIQLRGIRSDYSIEGGYFGVGDANIRDTLIYRGNDLIGVVQDRSSISDQSFVFASGLIRGLPPVQ